MLNSLTAFAAFAGVLITVIIGTSLAMCWYEHRMLGTRPARRTAVGHPRRRESAAPGPAPASAAEHAPSAGRGPAERGSAGQVPTDRALSERVTDDHASGDRAPADRVPAAAAPASAARRITPAASAGVALLALLLTVASRAGQAHPLIGTDRRAVTGDQRTPAGAAGRSAGLARRAGVRSPR